MNKEIFLVSKILCCITCNPTVRAAILDDNFLSYVLTFLSIGVVLALIVIVHIIIYAKRFGSTSIPLTPVPLITVALILGIGIGGFIDGIVFHQILQWHEMISSKLPPITTDAKSVNMFWDGIFHLCMLLVVITGIVLFWKLSVRRDVDKSGNFLWGGLLSGWGSFNIVEGIIDHHVIGLHNVRELYPHPNVWNYGFIIFSVIVTLVGYLVIEKRIRSHFISYML
jgi:uncharacterized membrane protein